MSPENLGAKLGEALHEVKRSAQIEVASPRGQQVHASVISTWCVARPVPLNDCSFASGALGGGSFAWEAFRSKIS